MSIGTLPQDFVRGLSALRTKIGLIPLRESDPALINLKKTAKDMVELFHNLDERLKRLESKAT